MQETCDQLLHASGVEERERLLGEAAAHAGAAAYLLDRARAALRESPQEAGRIAGLAASVAGHRGAARDEALAHRTVAQALRQLGRHEEALAAMATAERRAEEAGDARLAAQVQLGAIDSLGWLGRYEEAVTLAERLDSRFRDLEALDDSAKVLVNVGNLHFRRDRYDQALDAYRRAGAALEALGDRVTLARIEANEANVLTHLNRVDEAIGLYDRASAAFAEADLPLEAAMLAGNVGYLRFVSGMHAVALAAFTRAREAFEERGQEIEAAKADLDIGDTYRALNLHPEALEAYDRGIEVFARASVDYERAKCELGRAAILASEGRSAEALEALTRVEAVFRGQKNRLQGAHVHLIRATLLQSTGQVDEARQEAYAAARTFARGRLAGWSAEARFVPAAADLAEGIDATSRMRAVARVARRQAHGWLECRAEHALGRYYRRQGDLARAIRCFRRAAASLEDARTLIAPEELHVAFLRDKLAVYEDLVDALLERGGPRDAATALEYVERAKSRLLLERLRTSLEQRIATSGEQDAALLERIAQLRAELSRQYHALHSTEDPEHQRLASGQGTSPEEVSRLEREYRSALRRLEVSRSERSEAVLTGDVPGPDTLRDLLAPNEALLEFYVARGQVCAFVVNGRRVRSRRRLASLAEVEHVARRLRFHLQKAGLGRPGAAVPNLEAIRGVLARLYDLLLRPVADLLPQDRLIVAPHGALHGLPFHAFLDGSCYALDRWELLYSPSSAVWSQGAARALGRSRRVRTDGKALLMAVPDAGIEHVASEAETLAEMLPGASLFLAEQATTDRFRDNAPCSRIIHLATHGLYRADNPLFSGLRFSDGWLLARELYELRLECDLATLSACRTAVSFVEPGDELFGLLRGFLSAGVRTVSASLWPADDAATANLMPRFYRLMAGGETPAAALRRAQQETREEYPHPYHWAPFAVVGQ